MKSSEKLYSIQDVSRMLNVPKHTLRFWEREFEEVLLPLRTKGRQRRYTRETISIIEEIKIFRAKKMNLAEIKRVIRDSAHFANQNSTRIDLLAARVADMVKSEVYSFIKKELSERPLQKDTFSLLERGPREILETVKVKGTKRE
jgi:DNA-binding transcriptional MerR regulator